MTTHPQSGATHGSASSLLRRGDYVIVALAALTVIEFAVALSTDGNLLYALLSVVGLIKAVLIINYFMHAHQLWTHVTRVWDAYLFPDRQTEDEAEEENHA